MQHLYQGSGLDVRNIDFELQANRSDTFLCFTIDNDIAFEFKRIVHLCNQKSN